MAWTSSVQPGYLLPNRPVHCLQLIQPQYFYWILSFCCCTEMSGQTADMPLAVVIPCKIPDRRINSSMLGPLGLLAQVHIVKRQLPPSVNLDL